MQRKIIIALAFLVLLLAAASIFLLLRGQPQAAPISINTADENTVEPYHREMDCIDQLLQDNDLSANEIGPALDSCKGGGAGNQTTEQ